MNKKGLIYKKDYKKYYGGGGFALNTAIGKGNATIAGGIDKPKNKPIGGIGIQAPSQESSVSTNPAGAGLSFDNTQASKISYGVSQQGQSSASNLLAPTVKSPEMPKLGGIVDTGAAVASSQKSLDAATKVSAPKGASGGIKPMSATGQAGVAAGGAVAEMGAGLLTKDAGINYDNLDQEVSQGKIAAGGAISGAAKGAQMGMAFGPWGAAVGGVVGGVAGYFGGKKKAKEEEGKRKKLVIKRDINQMDTDQADLATESNRIAADVSSKYGKNGRALVAAKGTKFAVYYKPYESMLSSGKVRIPKRGGIKIFKIGGKMTSTNNIIPNGVSHDENNSMGTKGMPVVKCSKNYCSKMYEIESDELIFTKKSTNKIEVLSKGKKLKELGNFVKDQLLNNTHSYTSTFTL